MRHKQEQASLERLEKERMKSQIKYRAENLRSQEREMRAMKMYQQMQYRQMLDEQQTQVILKPQINGSGAKSAVRSAQYRMPDELGPVPYQRAAGQATNPGMQPMPAAGQRRSTLGGQY